MSKEYLNVSENVEEEEEEEEEGDFEEEEDVKGDVEDEEDAEEYYYNNEDDNEVSREVPGKYLNIEKEEYLNISPDDNDNNKYIKIGIYFCSNYEDNSDIIYDHNFERKKNEYEKKYEYDKKYGCSDEKFDFPWPFEFEFDPDEIFSHPSKLFDTKTNKPKFNIPEILNDFLKKNNKYKKMKIMFFNEGPTGPKGDSSGEKGPGVIEEKPFAIYGFKNDIEPNDNPDPTIYDPSFNAGLFLCDDNGEELIEFVNDNNYIINTAVNIGVVYKPYNDILIIQNPDREKSEYPKIQSIFAMTTDDYEKYIINRRRNIKENNKKIIENYKEQSENERKKREEDAEAERKKRKEEKEKRKEEKEKRKKEESDNNIKKLKETVGVIKNLFTKNKKKGEEMMKERERRRIEEEEREAAKNNEGNEFKGGKRIRRKTIRRKTIKRKTHKRIKHIKRKTIKRIKRKTHRRRH
jgi:hypothetical protein